MTESDTSTPANAVETTEPPTVTLAEFLANTPPYTQALIEDHWIASSGGGYRRNKPRILLHCQNEKCKTKGYLSFNSVGNIAESALSNSKVTTFEYRCSNCQQNLKIITVLIIKEHSVESQKAVCMKLGEVPPFGPPIPSQLMKMVGADRELFLKGRRCESQGLGIASFAYYRRVIEDQKHRFFDEIIKVTRLLEPNSELINELEKAKDETQFTKSIDAIKTAIPQGLKISGHNPLKLLHGALSEGLHTQSDEECLEIAGDVRVVLTTLAEKITEALNENKEVQDAVRKLAQRQQNKGQ